MRHFDHLLMAFSSIVLLASDLGSGMASAQTGIEADAENQLRRCRATREVSEPADRYAIRCAEHFVVEQGYTDREVPDMTNIVPEGIEWSSSQVEWLLNRRGTLDPRAVGICTDSDMRFTVVFRVAKGHGARGVTLDSKFGSIRVQHADFRLDVVESQ